MAADLRRGGATGTIVMRDQREMELMLRGYGLTTAEFLYRMPDHPGLLQSFVWQTYDIAPDFPALYRFIAFWKAAGRAASLGRLHAPPPDRDATSGATSR